MTDTTLDSVGKDLALGVVRNPLDATRRLILADWYEEQGRDRDARLMRLEGRVMLLYRWVAYVNGGNDIVILFRHRDGESIRCAGCGTGMKHREGFLYLASATNLKAGWVPTATYCYLLRHGRDYGDW
jgi:uncharacterized protein (TIGR02996 family)